MTRPRSATIALFFIGLVTLLTRTGWHTATFDAAQLPAHAPASDISPAATDSSLQITLVAPHTTTSWDARHPNPDIFDLPLLYLNHEGQAAPAAERTLEFQVSGLAASTALQIEAVSLHADVTTGEAHRVDLEFVTPDRPCTSDDPCVLFWTLDPSSLPSDMYLLYAKDRAGNTLWRNPYPGRPDFVALDTWEVALGAYTARVYYATLFPFARGENDLENRLRPEEVSNFIERQFVPIIAETWQVQAEAWGFGDPIHPNWDADKVMEVFVTDPPFALFGGTGTYTISVDRHGQPYPERRIWWFSSNTAFQAYDSLESAYRAVFAHEFFHTMQWNALLTTGCSPRKWNNVFIEAQGKFAPSVQYPELELLRGHLESVRSEYGSAAQRFLTHRLNSSFRDLETDRTDKYDAALYWRFLYEQYGDMGIIRAALEEMTCGYQADIAKGLEKVMDAALARYDGPFQTFEDSLVAFARANFALRLAHGRCVVENSTNCGAFYFDPNLMYTDPPLEVELDYDGSGIVYNGIVPAGFGIDLIEVRLDPALQTQPLTVTVRSDAARFNVELWKLGGGNTDLNASTLLAKLAGDSLKPQALTLEPERMPQVDEGLYVAFFPHLDTQIYDRLALIITRLDTDQAADRAGEYDIILQSFSGDGELPVHPGAATGPSSQESGDVSPTSLSEQSLPLTP